MSQITEYRTNLLNEINANASSNNTLDREEFLEYVTQQLISAEEIDDFIYVPYEGYGRRKKLLQIDGYFYSELDDCLCLFVATPLEYKPDDVLTSAEANKYISMATSFIENADYIKENAEESSPGYGLACDLLEIYSNVKKYKIYLISDKIKRESIISMNNRIINNKEVECHIWDITRLFNLTNSWKGKEELVINFTELGIPGIPCLPASKTSNYQAYLCNIPGIILAKLYNLYGSRLLEGNVRSFLQVKGKVNKGIRYTILNEPSMFFAYNNGIAATAYNLKTDIIDGMLYITEISSLQIVNGGQTTASLAAALINDKKDSSEEKIRHIDVPMKLSIVDPDKADTLIGAIAKYANSQNKVSDSDLWSNHPYHVRIEDFSRRIFTPSTNGRQYGTYWYYERANGQYAQETYKCTKSEKDKFTRQHPKDQLIKKTDWAKYIHIYSQRPDIASTGGQKAFLKFANEIAAKWEKSDLDFNEQYFKDMISIAILYRKTDKIVRSQKWYNSYKANIVAYTLSLIFYKVSTDYPDYTINLNRIWLKQDLSLEWIKQLEESSHIVYNFLIDENRGVENVTEWAKREACWEKAKKLDIHLSKNFIQELQNKADSKEEKKAAKRTQKLDNKLNSILEVANYGIDKWAQLLAWNNTHHVLNPIEVSKIQKVAANDYSLLGSEKECERVLNIKNKCIEEGFPG